MAKYYMGVSFLQGRGVRRDIHLARYWFKQAAKAGHKKAIFYLAKVEKSLHNNNRYITKSYLSKYNPSPLINRLNNLLFCLL